MHLLSNVPKRCQCRQSSNLCENIQPLILVHGGAGKTRQEKVPKKLEGVKCAVYAALNILKNGGNAVEATEAAVRYMEDDENFNAGYGSVLTIEGNVEMDASIMSGENLNAGAVACIKNVANPISVARKIMEKTPHVILSSEGALRFAEKEGFQILPDGSLVTENSKLNLVNFKKMQKTCPDKEGGTVGAVALDKFGHVAAATSTGGTVGKLRGRVGDSPQIGSGTYADDEMGAVSSTGHGESILKYCLAHKILLSMKEKTGAQEATKNAIDALTKRLHNTAGAITVSRCGDIGIYHSTATMSWAYCVLGQGVIKFGIKYDDCNEEPLSMD